MEHIGEAQTETERERQVSKQWRGGHAGTAEWVQGSGQLHADTVHAGTVVASTSHLRSKSIAKENLVLLCQALACGGCVAEAKGHTGQVPVLSLVMWAGLCIF